VLVKELNVVIFQGVHSFAVVYVECSKVIVVLTGPYSCALCKIWSTYVDCGLLAVT